MDATITYDEVAALVGVNILTLEPRPNFERIRALCWKVSARPSARLPLKSNLSVIPTGRPKALSRPQSLQCNKTIRFISSLSQTAKL